MANELKRQSTKELLGQLGTDYICDDVGCCSWYNASDVDANISVLNAKLTTANAKLAEFDTQTTRKDTLINLLRGQRDAAWQREDELKKQQTELKELAYANLYGTQIICNSYLPVGTIAYALDRDVFYVTGIRWQELTDAERELKAERESNEEKRTMMRQMNRTIIDQTNTIKALRSALSDINEVSTNWLGAPIDLRYWQAFDESYNTISKIAELSENAEKPATGAESSGSSR